MAKFRLRPIVVEAMQYDGSADSFNCIWDWACPSNDTLKSPVHFDNTDDDPGMLYVQTIDGERKAFPGDWIVKGVAGDFFPCKSDVFEQIYEQVED